MDTLKRYVTIEYQLLDADITPIAGFGSVHDVPWLPDGFAGVFDSWSVPANGIRLHAMIGGSGPPLLLLAGWPQSWYAWRHLMLPLAKLFTVIAVDPRGYGLSDKPDDGYDSDGQVADMLSLMTSLGHARFAMIGHDIGMWTGYCMAADAPDRIVRIAMGEALIPGLSPSPPLIPEDRWLSDLLWHHNFNRAIGINEAMVSGREALYFGHQFATKAATADGVPAYARDFYIRQLEDPRALWASFEYYRALDDSILQHRRRKAAGMLQMPVLTFAGEKCCGPMVEAEISAVSDDLRSFIIADAGHYPAEEKPDEMLAVLQPFLTPYAQKGG